MKRDFIGKDSIIVAHPGQQHSYRTAAAVKKAGLLHRYITTVYYNPSRLIYKVLGKLLNKDNRERMKGRVCNELALAEIIQYREMSSLFLLCLLRIDKSKRISSWFMDRIDISFSRKVARYALKRDTKCVIMYDIFAGPGFEILKNSGITRILDVSIAARNYTYEIYKEDIKKCGLFSKTYTGLNVIRKPSLMKMTTDEIKESDYFIVPSTFVRDSIKYNGIDEKRIYIVPYGTDTDRFKYTERKKLKKGDTVNFLFAGTIGQRKGIYYLLEAFRQLNLPNVKLYLAGQFIGDESLYKPYKDIFTYAGHVIPAKMPEIYSNAQVYIFPSLWEGFSLTILEAMSSGLPVIATPNTGCEGIIEDGIDGFIIPHADIEALKEKILFFSENPEQIYRMSLNARKKAEDNSWKHYEAKYTCAVNEILKMKRNQENHHEN